MSGRETPLRPPLRGVVRWHDALRAARAEAAAQASWIRSKGEQLRATAAALRELDHELVTPVAVLQGYCANLLDGLAGPLTAEQRAWLERVRAAGELVAGVVERFRAALPDERLVADALSHDARKPRRGRLHLRDVAEAATALVAEAARARAVALETSVDPRCPPVWGERSRLVQLVVNLLANAVRHAPQGGHVALAVTLRAEPGARPHCRVTVRDDGPGVPPEDRWKVFFPGFTTDPQRRGLGLAIAAEVAAEHGAALHVEGAPGEGATFVLDLPVDPRARRRGPDAAGDARSEEDTECPRC